MVRLSLRAARPSLIALSRRPLKAATARQVFISLAPEPVLVLDGSKWGFQVYHEGALKGQGTMLVYVDADAISFQLKPGESVKVEGVLVKSKTQVTVGASAVERLSCNDTNSCR